jgi:hypothetical protein
METPRGKVVLTWSSGGPTARETMDLRFLSEYASPPLKPLRLEGLRWAVFDRLRIVYSAAAPWTGGAAIGALLAAIGVAIVRRRLTYFAVVGFAMLGSILALVSIMAFIYSISFPALDTGYLAGGHVLWMSLMFVGWLALAGGLRRGSAKVGAIPPSPQGP